MPKKRLRMGELEAQVMAVLWNDGEWLTPAQVHDALGHERSLAYTTVTTVLVRLHDKGLVERTRDGRAYAYHAVQTREEHTAARMAELLAAGGDRSLALSRFLDAIGPSERARLRRMLGRNR